MWLWVSGSLLLSCAPLPTCVNQHTGLYDPMCPCLSIESMTPCRFSVCVGCHCLLSLKRVQLESSGGGNQTYSCLACDFCLDTSARCDMTHGKVLGCHGLVPRLYGD